MCGITGIWSRNCDLNHIREDTNAAVASLRHRGPDDSGVWLNRTGLALGHTRLSILDLSSAGHQPMVSTDGRYCIVFNGEIYNFAEIRTQLETKGHRFSGTGDTEVVLAAFQEWGTAAVEQFIGMFAIALWDEVEKRLELIRDRVGVKPLHYGWLKGTLWFASELKAMRAYRHWIPNINMTAAGEFLQYGYIAEDRTIYEGVYKLRPGHKMLLKEGQEPRVECYWSGPTIQSPLTLTESDAEYQLEKLLIDAFRYRMISDVPVGLYLSGGVDSSVVVSLLAKHFNRDIRTFTIGFGDNEHDESKWAKRVAQHCGTRHTEYILDVDEALEIAKAWGSLFDEPFGDSSGIPTYLVSKLASNDVKVVLSADGGDELFSGYKVYGSVLSRLATLRSIPPWLSRTALPVASSLLTTLLRLDQSPTLSRGGRLLRRAKRFNAMLKSPTAGELMEMYLSYWDPDQVRTLIGAYTTPRRTADDYPGDLATKLSLWDIDHYLPEDILTKVDRTTMAVSIEGREPLLDHRLVEYALSLPPHLRRGDLGPKHILKRILYKYVPRELVDRPKQGFAIPLTRWLRTDLSELVRDYLSESRLRACGIFNSTTVTHAVTRFHNGDDTLSSQLWFLLAFEMWREKWG